MADPKNIWEVRIEALIGLHKAETRLMRYAAAPSAEGQAIARARSPGRSPSPDIEGDDDDDALLVSGAGTLQVNGVYKKTAQILGRPTWTKPDDSNYVIQWSEDAEAWIIDYVPGNAPYCIKKRQDMMLPLDAPWSSHQGGKAPMPTVKPASGASSMHVGGLMRGRGRAQLEPEPAAERKKGVGFNLGARFRGRSPASSPAPPVAEVRFEAPDEPLGVGDDSDSDGGAIDPELGGWGSIQAIKSKMSVPAVNVFATTPGVSGSSGAKFGPGVSSDLLSSTTSGSLVDGKCANLGAVIVVVQIGQAMMRTGEIKVTGEEAKVECPPDEVLRLPAPPPGRDFAVKVRVLQAGTRLHSEKLVGEAQFEEATGETFELVLYRHGKGKAKGGVQLTVTAVEETPEELLARTEGLSAFGGRTGSPDSASGKTGRTAGIMGTFSRMGRKGKKGGDLRGSLFAPAMREALLAEEEREFSKLGDITLTIESVNRLVPRVKHPFFVTWLGEQEGGQMENFTKPVQEHFVMRHVESNVVILCYDGDPSTKGKQPIGRIVLPLSDLFWESGSAPGCGQLCSFFRSPKKLSKSYQARFMPISEEGRDAQFQPAWAAAPGTGFWKKDVFGNVAIRLDLDFDKKAKRSMLRQQIAGVQRQLKMISLRTQVTGSLTQKEDEIEQSLWAVVNSIDLSRNARIASRASNMLNDIASGKAKGFIRWVRAKKWNGVIVGVIWFIFCASGAFPPKPYLWPLYIWATLLLNGLIAAKQRQSDWRDARSPPFHIWNEEIEPPPPSTSISEKLTMIKKAAKESERVTDNIVCFLDRLSQMFLFADGPASVLVYILTFVAAALFSLAWFGLDRVDPDARFSIGFVGLLIFPLCSIPLPKKTQVAIQADPLLPLVNFNSVFSFIPDQTEVAHRYIAAHVQCRVGPPADSVRVTLISARGLRAADTAFFGQGSSDPYCVVEIPGKPASKLTTHIIKKTLSPEWNYEGVMEDFAPGDSLNFTVWDWDRTSRDDLLGRVTLKPSEFHPDGFDGELTLSDAGAGIQATLRVRITVEASLRAS